MRDWEFQFKAKGGHSFFTDRESGRVAIADDSGPTPDTTDDGVLWLVGVDHEWDGRDHFFVVVEDDSGKMLRSPCYYGEFVSAQGMTA
jgi:hypothetical protein